MNPPWRACGGLVVLMLILFCMMIILRINLDPKILDIFMTNLVFFFFFSWIFYCARLTRDAIMQVLCKHFGQTLTIVQSLVYVRSHAVLILYYDLSLVFRNIFESFLLFWYIMESPSKAFFQDFVKWVRTNLSYMYAGLSNCWLCRYAFKLYLFCILSVD